MSIPIQEGYWAKCSRCESRAVVRVPYAKLNLCRDHFLGYIEERVYRTVERYKMLRGAKRLLVALSGGKDSLSLLYLLNSLKGRLGLEAVVGFHLDLGIGEYSKASSEAVSLACNENSTECFTVSLRELTGFTLPEIVRASRRPACSVCGALKRYFVNAVALELGVDAVSLGHHMDDILAFALKDFMLQDLADLAKMVPVVPGVPGLLVTRLKLLYETYESDLELYANLRGIRYLKTHCPFKYRDPFKSAIRKMLDELEAEAPGFKLSLARRLAKNMFGGISGSSKPIVPCKHCKMPSSTGECTLCKLTARITGKPLGPVVRERLKSLLRPP